MKKLIMSFILLSIGALAQSYNPQNEYKEIKEDNIRIVYPKEMKEEADEVLSTIIYQNKNNLISVEGAGKDFVIILNKDTTVSNGFVTMGPFRGEFFGTMPLSSYDISATSWFQTLSIHEYRHALQMMHGREGTINKILYFLGGENSVSMANNLAVPRWYWEGDAVCMETALSSGGRGRSNYFLKEYKQRFLDGDDFFSYEKAKNGSFYEKVPDHYLLGYLMTAYGREVYGYDFWKDIFGDSVKYYGLPPFSKALKNKTGKSSEEFYFEAMKWWKEKWVEEEKNYDIYESIVKENSVPADYIGAYEYKDKYLTLKKSFDSLDSFILIDSQGNEEKIVDKTISISNDYHYNRGFIAWNQYGKDKINSMVDYSNIVLYDMENEKLIEVSKDSKYFGPNIANTKKEIAVVKIESTNNHSIEIIDFDGKLIKTIKKDNYFFNNPTWSADDKELITTVKNKAGETGLVAIEVEGAEIETLIPFGNYIIEDIWVDNENIYFSATFDLIDNIYVFNRTSKEIKKISNSRYGAYGPSVIKNSLIFSQYENGNYILKKNSNIKEYEFEFEFKELNKQKSYQFDFFQNEGGNITDKIDFKIHEEEDYNSIKNLINFHSWSYSYDQNTLDLNLMSTNETTDLDLNFYMSRDFEKKENLIGIGGTFNRYWPELSLLYERDNKENKNNQEVEIGLGFPIDMTGGYYYRLIKPSISYLYNKDKLVDLNSYKLSLDLSNIRDKAYMNLMSRYSQQINLSYIDSFDKNASKLNLDSYFTFGAFGINDYTQIGLAYEKQDNKNDYEYTEDFNLPRGYKDIENDDIFKVSFDYGLPMFYPDRGIDGLYVKRISSVLFYDYADYELNNKKDTISSVGAELYFDVSILSLMDMNVGLRYSYKIESEENQFDVVIPLQSF